MPNERPVERSVGRLEPERDLMPEHTARWNDHNSSAPIHPEVKAAYDYVSSVRDTADFKGDLAWHGWALREAFLAGCSHASKTPNAELTGTQRDD